MKTLLLHESVNQAWSARDRRVVRATEHVALTGPCAKEAESWALQPGCRADADLFNDFAFIVKDSDLRLPFVEVDAHVVISGRGHDVLWSPECVKRNDIAAGLRPRPTRSAGP